MRSGLPGRNQRQFHRETESRIFQGTSAPQRGRIIISFRIGTSKSRDRAPSARAPSEDRHLRSGAAARKQSNRILTLQPRQLPLGSATKLSVALDRQISRRPVARDHSENFDRRNSAADTRFPESL